MVSDVDKVLVCTTESGFYVLFGCDFGDRLVKIFRIYLLVLDINEGTLGRRKVRQLHLLPLTIKHDVLLQRDEKSILDYLLLVTFGLALGADRLGVDILE